MPPVCERGAKGPVSSTPCAPTQVEGGGAVGGAVRGTYGLTPDTHRSDSSRSEGYSVCPCDRWACMTRKGSEVRVLYGPPHRRREGQDRPAPPHPPPGTRTRTTPPHQDKRREGAPGQDAATRTTARSPGHRPPRRADRPFSTLWKALVRTRAGDRGRQVGHDEVSGLAYRGQARPGKVRSSARGAPRPGHLDHLDPGTPKGKATSGARPPVLVVLDGDRPASSRPRHPRARGLPRHGRARPRGTARRVPGPVRSQRGARARRRGTWRPSTRGRRPECATEPHGRPPPRRATPARGCAPRRHRAGSRPPHERRAARHGDPRRARRSQPPPSTRCAGTRAPWSSPAPCRTTRDGSVAGPAGRRG
jgi:hypothetical protein